MIGAVHPAVSRILVVDDSESNRYVIATWLRRAGYEVDEARSGDETLALTRNRDFDLVILDVNLPDMSGYEVCERIKAATRTAVLPVLHVSATATDSADLSEGLRRGAEGYLAEPVDREALIATVEALLRTASAQRTALRLATRLRKLNDATLAVNEAANLPALVATIAREAHALFDGATAIASVIVDAGAITEIAAHPGAVDAALTPEALDALRGAGGGGRLIAAPAIGERLPNWPSKTYVSEALDNPDGQPGILLVEFNPNAPTAGVEDETDVVLSLYARAASTALKNMRMHDIERSIAITLQHSLLPDALPAIAGLDVAVRYAASAEHAQVGGDFYEMFALDADRVLFAIGDVAGHSLEAATVMAQLRTSIRSYALESHRPAAILAALNNVMRRFHRDMTATVCCAVFDRRSGRCEMANAGHLPPLLVTRGGAAFRPIGGLLLGVDEPQIAEDVFALRPADVLLLFTDGLVERRRESIDAGLERLALVAADTTGGADALCDRVMREAGPSKIVDDIALMAIARTA